MKKLFALILMVVSLSASAQTKISDMQNYNGNMNGVYAPVAIGGANRKVDLGLFLRVQDSTTYLTKAWYKKGMDSLGAVISTFNTTLASKLNASDTANRWVRYVGRNATNDSIVFYIGSTKYAIVDHGGPTYTGSAHINIANDTLKLQNISPSFPGEYAYVGFDNTTEDLTLYSGSLSSLSPLTVTYSGIPAGKSQRDPSVIKVGYTYWMVHTLADYDIFAGTTQTSFGLSKSYDLQNWQFVKEITVTSGDKHVFAPEWFVENGRYYVIYSYSSSLSLSFTPYWLEITSLGDNPTYTEAQPVTGTSVPTSGLRIDYFLQKVGSTYYLFYTDLTDGWMRYITSSSPFSGYNTAFSYAFPPYQNQWSEALQLKFINGLWYAFFDLNPSGLPGIYFRTATTLTGPWSATQQVPVTSGILRHGTIIEKDQVEPRIQGISITGSATKTITFTYADGSTRSASFTDSTGSGGSVNDVDSLNSQPASFYLNRSNHTGTQAASTITQDASNRFVSDGEKTTWNAKQDALVSGLSIKTINNNSLLGSGNLSITGGDNDVDSLGGQPASYYLGKVDSTLYSTKAGKQKSIDSLASIMGLSLTSKLDKSDSTLYATVAGKQKSIDSLNSVIQTRLDAKADQSHTHTNSDITNFSSAVRSSISLNFTTSGTSGAASGSYNSSTGVFSINVPQYSGGGLTEEQVAQQINDSLSSSNNTKYFHQNAVWASGTQNDPYQLHVKDSLYRKPGVDSIFFVRNGTEYAILDSVGGGGGGGSLPSQSGHAGKFLVTDGSNASWSTTISERLTGTFFRGTDASDWTNPLLQAGTGSAFKLYDGGAGNYVFYSANNASISAVSGDNLKANSDDTYLPKPVTVGASTTPNASAVLEIVSTSKGLLLPRMTKAQRDAIASPVAGLMIYQTDNTPGLRVYNGTNWMRFTETAD